MKITGGPREEMVQVGGGTRRSLTNIVAPNCFGAQVWAPSPLLIVTGGLIPLFCLEGVPAFPGASQDEAGLTKIFET